LAIELTDKQARALAEAAKQLQVSEAELAAAAAKRVLRKNEELYRRLA
jgi:precorrin-6B methylase 2